MNKKNESKQVKTVIFWGSLWGLSEATLGSFFHIMPWIAGFFMFPIGFYFIKRALNDSGKAAAIFYTAAIAAGIKLTGLLLPFQHPAKVLNPAASIMMEAMVVFLFCSVFNFQKGRFRTLDIISLTLGWKLLFITYHVLLFTFSLSDGILQMSLPTMMRFLVPESICNVLLISFFLRIEKSGKEPFFKRVLQPGFINSSILLAAAVFAELML